MEPKVLLDGQKVMLSEVERARRELQEKVEKKKIPPSKIVETSIGEYKTLLILHN